MSKLLAIVGSTRPTRAADLVLPWLTGKVSGHQAFDDDGQPRNPVMNAAADIMLDDLAWWSAALEKARAGGELPPGSLRMRAALAPAQA